MRLTGDGAGAFASPTPFNLGVAPYHGTTDMLALVRRSNVGAAPQLAFQHQPGGDGSQVCISSTTLDTATTLVCHSSPPTRCVSYDVANALCNAPGRGPLAVGDLNGRSRRAARRDRHRRGR